MQLEKQQHFIKKNASKNGTTRHVCNKQENTLATNSVTTSSQKELPGNYLQSKPTKNKITATATVPASDWVTNCTPPKKALGRLTSTWSLRFLHSAGLSGALLVAVLLLFFRVFFRFLRNKQNKQQESAKQKSDKQCDI